MSRLQAKLRGAAGGRRIGGMNAHNTAENASEARRPFFSVVAACCDVEPYVRECFSSLAGQDFADWECIAFVEESKDATERVVRETAAADPRFRVLTGPRTGSCSVPRNRGIEEARGEYVIFLDGDDTLAEGSLARLHDEIAARPGADMYQGAIRVVDGKTGTETELRDNYPPDAPAELSGPEATLLSEKFRGHPCPMLQMTVFRRDFLLENGLRCIPGLRRQDSEFSPRALYLARRVVPVHEPFYVYRLREGAVGSSARGHGYFLGDWSEICRSLFSFAAGRSLEPDFDRRAAACWARQWIPRVFYFWFSPDAVRTIPREKRASTVRAALAGSAADGFRLLAKTLPRSKRAACRAALAFAGSAAARPFAEAFFRVYFALADRKRRKGADSPAPGGASPASAGAKRPTALLYYRYFGGTLGGGEYLPLAFAAELQKTCDVVMALDWTNGFERAAATMGVPLDVSRVRAVQVMPEGFRATTNGPLDSLRRFRKLRTLAAKADIRISMANIMDFGRPAHHFLITTDLGDPGFAAFASGGAGARPPLRRRVRKAVEDRLLRPLLGMRSKAEIVGDPRERIHPNSRYAGSLVAGYYGAHAGETFYPPTLFEPLPPEKAPPRDPFTVLYIGRVSPAKGIDAIAGIVEKARAISGKPISLRIAGKLDDGPFKEKLLDMAARRPWMSLEGEKYGEEKARFIASGSFAVHVLKSEAFGISVTEYLKAGLVPVVPDEGGAREVVDDPALSFPDHDSAAAILARLATDAAFREEKRASCAKRAAFFSRDAYLARQSAMLESILA